MRNTINAIRLKTLKPITILLLFLVYSLNIPHASDLYLISASTISDSVRSNGNILIINFTEAGTVVDNTAGKGDGLTKLCIGRPFSNDPNQYIIWLKFGLSDLDDNMEILSAKIYMFMIYQYDNNDPPIYVHFSSDDSWTASSITGISYPDYNQQYTDVNTGPFSSGKWYSWNITTDVQKEMNGNKIISLMLSNHKALGYKEFNKVNDYPEKEPYIEVKFKSVSNLDVSLTNGDGNGTEIYAGYRYQFYNINTKIFSYKNSENVDYAKIHFDPTGADVIISWDRVNDRVIEINDNYDCLILGPFSSNYQNNIWHLNISIQFGLTYPTEKLSNIQLETIIGDYKLDEDIYDNIFIIRKNLVFNGNLQASSEYQGPLSNDNWVRNHEKLLFSGLKVVYESDKERSPKENTCQIKISDDLGNFESVYIDSDGTFGLSITAELTTNSYNNYHFSIIPDSADKTSIAPFRLRVDGTAPTAPANFKVHADSLLDTSTISDNDGEIYLSWSSSVETGSSIKGYYYGEVGTTPIYTTDTTGQISGLDEGIHNFEVYAEDNVGNIGDKITASVIIDMTDPSFSSYSPGENLWVNKTPIFYSITITDIGSGVNTNTIEYAILKSGSDEWGTWQKPDNINTDDNDTIITAEKELNLPEGKKNFIKWRVKDRAGNGPIESNAYRIMVDTKPVEFSGFSPTNSEKRNISANITIKDTSGIGSLEYRLKLTGDNEYGQWQSLEILEFDTIITVSIPIELPFGNTHKIQFRTSDIAGNGIILSDEYQIKINSRPKVIITSPDPTVTYETSDMILFDASQTIDEDNDTLKYYWESDIMGELRRTASFKIPLKYGSHEITLRVTDEGGHVVNVSFDLEVLPVDTDGDGLDDSEDSDDDDDGMPDYWEYIYGLNPLKNDAQNDKDGDGYTNKEEYNAGTDPSDKDSHPKGLSSSMVSTIIVLVVVMLIIIIAMGIGFILYRRNIKKRLIVPEVVSKPGVPGGVVLPGGVPIADALPGTAASIQTGIALPGPPTSMQQPQYLLPEHKMSPEEILYQLDQRLALGEISEDKHNELKEKYEKMVLNNSTIPKKKKVKKRKKLPDKNQEQEIGYNNQ